MLRYEVLARRFLQERADAVGNGFVEDLTGTDVVGFLVRECTRLAVGSGKGRVAELRSLLRFLYLTGCTPLPLATAVPPVAGWHDASLPVGISAVDVQRLLEGCDRNSPGGIGDFAILILVARLGLRSAEVARLELGDIDWRAGELVVRGKGRRQDRLPLPSDVGEALSALSQGCRGPPCRFDRCSWRERLRRGRFAPIWSATWRAERAIGLVCLASGHIACVMRSPPSSSGGAPP